MGSQRARVLVDTGAPKVTLFLNRMQSRLPGFRLKSGTTVQSAGGMSQVRDVELAAVRLGPTEWLRVPAFLLDAPGASSLDLDGVLGPPSLAVRCMRFDFVRNRLSWER